MSGRRRLEDDPALEPVMDCSICFSRLTRPKLLGCSHSFCQSCLSQCNWDGAEIECPLCKRVTTNPRGRAENLPDDFRHNTLVDCLRKVKLEDYQDDGDEDEDEEVESIQIFVNNFRGRNIAIDVNLADDTLDLKDKIEAKEGIPPQEQRLIFGGKQLEDGCKLHKYKIGKACTVQMVARMNGG